MCDFCCSVAAKFPTSDPPYCFKRIGHTTDGNYKQICNLVSPFLRELHADTFESTITIIILLTGCAFTFLSRVIDGICD